MFIIALLVTATIIRLRAEDDARAGAIFQKLIAANEARDYEAFVADGTPELKAALSQTQFTAAASLLAPKFSKNPTISLLGEVNQRGFEVYLYRLRFTDGSDDILGTLSLKNGQVAGILFR
jgi:hypothetical protein